MSSAGNDSPPGAINIDAMSLDQLNSFKQQEESRLEQLTAQYHQLRAVSARLSSARSSLAAIPANNGNSGGGGGGGGEGREIMVPLTESLYAPGRIVDPNKILVELGAGFFVEKSSKDAIKVLERKGRVVDANSDNVMRAAEATSRNAQAIEGAMQGKMMEIRARQQGIEYKNQMEGKQ